jgi:hypothetical protein
MAPIVRQGLAALLALCSGSAAASALPKVIPLPFRPDEGVLEKSAVRFNGLLMDELKTRDADLQPLAPLLAGQKPKMPTGEPAPEAVKAMESARRRMADLDLKGAVADYYQGLTLYLADPATADFAEVSDGFLQLAVASFRLGREKEAQRALTNLYRLNPAQRLAAGRFPPVFLREAQRARERLEGGNRVTLIIEGPPGARALVDGRLAGPVPVKVQRLYAGTHYVRVDGAQGERFGQVVEVPSGEATVRAVFLTAQEIALQSTVPPVVGPVLDADLEQRLRTYCNLVGAQYALVGMLMHAEGHRIVVGSALYSAARGGFTVLEQRTMDELLNGANVEAYRLADSVVAAIRAFGDPAPLPIALRSKPPPTGAPPVETARSDPAARERARPRLIPEGPGEGGSAANGGTTASRTGTGTVGVTSRGSPPRDPETLEEWASSVPWWGWALAGVGVGVLAAGTTFAIVQANRPISGTVTVRW